MRAFTLLLSLSIVVSVARANLAMDPQRKPDPAFARFFLPRTDRWLRANLFDYLEKRSKSERAFVEQSFAMVQDLGRSRGDLFIPSYAFSFGVKGDTVAYGPVRFAQAYPDEGFRARALEVVKSHHVTDALGDVIGLGFTRDPHEIEVIEWKDGEVISLYRDGKRVARTVIEHAASAPTCPAVLLSAQVSHVKDSSRYLYRPTAFQDEPLSMAGRRLIFKVTMGLNLIPGEIDYLNQTDYQVSYP